MAARRPLVIDTTAGRLKELPSGDVLAVDGWTYVKVTSDFTTSLATFSDVLVAAAGAALGFTPAANTDYEVEGALLIATATATVGPRPGFTWGTGYQYGACRIAVPTALTTEAIQHNTIGTVAGTNQAPVGGLPTTGAPYFAWIDATFRSGTTPTPFKVQLASETAGTVVTIKAGSFIRYRTIG
jgi:hypothetical protein